MKKNKKLILIFSFILGIILIPNKALAATSTSVSCPSKSSVGSIITCTINVTSDQKINGVAGKFSLNGVVQYNKFEQVNGFTSLTTNANGFSVQYPSGKTGTFAVIKIKFKVLKAGSFSFTSFDLSDTKYNSYSPGNITKSIALASTNNYLSALSISDGNISPAFNKSTGSYTATVNKSSTTISATKGEAGQTISGTGKKNLSYGKNTFKVTVKSESGSSRTYTIVITRPDNRSKVNYLSSLSTNSGNVNFNKDTTSYSLTVSKDTSSIKVDASLQDSKSKFVSGYGPRTVSLKPGKNTIQIKVQAENGSVKTYTINVTKPDGRDDNNNLKSLKITNANISFSKSKTEYSIEVDNKVEKLEITAEKESSKATMKIDNPTLKVGDNTVKITVTAENTSKKVYIIKVKRLSESESRSDNNNLKSVTIVGHPINFKSNVKEYTVKIHEECALVFKVELEDKKSTYRILGNEKLEDGSTIKIEVTSQTGKVKVYSFRIMKEKKEECDDKATSNDGVSKTIVVGLCIFTLVAGLFIGFLCGKARKTY